MKVVKVYSLKQAFKDLIVCPVCRRKPVIRIRNTQRGPHYFIRCDNNHKDFHFFGGDDFSLRTAVNCYNERIRINLDNK